MSSRTAERSARRRGSGTATPARRRPCAARRRRTTIAIFRNPICRHSTSTAEWVDEIRRTLPELPEARKARFVATLGLSDYDADLLVRLIAGGADYFEALVAAGAPAKAASNWIQGEIRRRLKDLGADDMSAVPVAPDALAELVGPHRPGRHQQHGRQGRLRQDVDDRQSGAAKSSSAKAWLRSVTNRRSRHGRRRSWAPQPDAVAQYRAGRTNTFGFLVGQVMKASQGKANPKVVSDLLKKALDG